MNCIYKAKISAMLQSCAQISRHQTLIHFLQRPVRVSEQTVGLSRASFLHAVRLVPKTCCARATMVLLPRAYSLNLHCRNLPGFALEMSCDRPKHPLSEQRKETAARRQEQKSVNTNRQVLGNKIVLHLNFWIFLGG